MAAERAQEPMTLLAAGAASGTDKVAHHAYHRFYQPFVDALLRRVPAARRPALLEIGVAGGASVPMWAAALPGWALFGMDILPPPPGVAAHAEFTPLQGDQGVAADLERVAAAITARGDALHFINDDGSHVPAHQALTFGVLFPHLCDGGVYAIEDIETSYWRSGALYGYGIRHGYGAPTSIVERFKGVADVVNWEFLDAPARAALAAAASASGLSLPALRDVSTLTFGHNCVVLTKKTDEGRALDARPYRFALYW